MMNLKNIGFALCVCITLCFVGCKEDEPYYVSMNAQEKHLFIGEQFLFTVTQQGAGALQKTSINWSVSESSFLKIDSVTSKGMYATAIKTNNDGVVVRAELSNGRYAMAKVFVQQRLAGDSDMSFIASEIFMSVGTTDSVELRLSLDFLKRFPDVKVESSNPELLQPSLQITDTISYVKLKALSNFDGEAIVTVTAGEKKINCKVNLGVYLYLSFADISTALGKPQVIEKESFTFLISSNKPANTLDTIKVRYLAIPDDVTHLDGVKFKVSTSGEHGVIWIKGYEKKFIDNKHLLYIYLETSSKKGLAHVEVESLGKKVIADVDVIDMNDIKVQKLNFKKELYSTETSLDLTGELAIKPLDVALYWPTSWSISTTNAATISSTGFLTINKAGTFTVSAQIRESVATCTIQSKLRVLNVSLPLGDKNYATGETVIWEPTVTANFSTVESSRISWSSSNTSIATVNAEGKITAVAAGESEITVTVTDDFGGSYSAKKRFKVSDYNIYDLMFEANDYAHYVDKAGVRLALDVFLIEDDSKSYNITLNLSSGSWDLSQNKTYIVGQELTNNGSISFGQEGTSADIQSGSIRVENNIITYNLVASKGSKTITIKGSTVQDL